MPPNACPTGSQPRCYQTTSCLRLFSSPLATFEVLKQLLIGGILEPQTTDKTKGGRWGGRRGCGCSDSSAVLWGKRDLHFLFWYREWGVKATIYYIPLETITVFKNESVHVSGLAFRLLHQRGIDYLFRLKDN